MFSRRTRVKFGELFLITGGILFGVLAVLYGTSVLSNRWLMLLGVLACEVLMVEGSWRIRKESFTLPQGMALWRREQNQPPEMTEESIGLLSHGRTKASREEQES